MRRSRGLYIGRSWETLLRYRRWVAFTIGMSGEQLDRSCSDDSQLRPPWQIWLAETPTPTFRPIIIKQSRLSVVYANRSNSVDFVCEFNEPFGLKRNLR